MRSPLFTVPLLIAAGLLGAPLPHAALAQDADAGPDSASTATTPAAPPAADSAPAAPATTTATATTAASYAGPAFVTLRPPRATGYSPAAVTALVQRRDNLARLKTCYTDHLSVHPTARGALSADFNVIAGGMVIMGGTRFTPTRDADLENCMRRAIEGFRWAPPRVGGSSEIHLVFDLALTPPAPRRR